jgi:hypothetical protein
MHDGFIREKRIEIIRPLRPPPLLWNACQLLYSSVRFGITFCGSRRAVTSLSALPETGTDKFIYDVGIAPFTSQVIGAGKWVSIRGNLLPHMRTGLQEAWRRGYLAGSSNSVDYRIGDVNIGWEITGLNEAAMTMKAFSTKATLK